jgi:hypothetical protein
MNFYRPGGAPRKRFQKKNSRFFGAARDDEYAGSMQSVIGDYFGVHQRTLKETSADGLTGLRTGYPPPRRLPDP